MTKDLRAHAEKRLKDRRQFWATAITLVAIFVVLTLIWGVTSGWDGYFWPMWPGVGFIIAIIFTGIQVFSPLSKPISEDAIDREVRRLGGDPAARD